METRNGNCAIKIENNFIQTSLEQDNIVFVSKEGKVLSWQKMPTWYQEDDRCKYRATVICENPADEVNSNLLIIEHNVFLIKNLCESIGLEYSADIMSIDNHKYSSLIGLPENIRRIETYISFNQLVPFGIVRIPFEERLEKYYAARTWSETDRQFLGHNSDFSGL